MSLDLDMMHEAMTVRIDGEPFLSRARDYRAQYDVVRRAWIEFGEKIGGRPSTRYSGGLFFDRKPPEGWAKRDRKGWSYPKQRSAAAVELAALPKLPSARTVFGDAIVESYHYKSPNGEGAGAIGFFFDGVRLGWAGDTFTAVIPDPRAAARNILRDDPDAIICRPVLDWTLAPGLTEITEAERQLIFAQYRVAAEREQRRAA
jgi:hypothetical protein